MDSSKTRDRSVYWMLVGAVLLSLFTSLCPSIANPIRQGYEGQEAMEDLRLCASDNVTTAADHSNENNNKRLTASTEKPLNIILITISSLRADHTGIGGYTKQTTPHFDTFARENIYFTNAFAVSSWMMPAHGSLFTSLYPTHHGATHIDKKLNEANTTLAEILSRNGYYCAGFCFGPRLDDEYGFAQGFHYYDDFSLSIMQDVLAAGGPPEKLSINQQRTNGLLNAAACRCLKARHSLNAPSSSPRSRVFSPGKDGEAGDVGSIVDAAGCSQGENKPFEAGSGVQTEPVTYKPFFLFLHYYDNHWDYLPPSPYETEFDLDYDGPINGRLIAREPLYSNEPDDKDVQHMMALYDGEVKQTDADLGDLLQTIESLGLDRNSLIIVMGDHGDQFYEHGHTSHHGLWDELVHIPMAISLPNNIGKTRQVENLISQVDIMPTILDYLGISMTGTCHGQSFKPLLDNAIDDFRKHVYLEYTGGAVGDCFAVRSKKYKVLFEEQEKATLVFDLKADPGEQHPISPSAFDDNLADYLEYAQTYRNREDL